MINIVAYRLDGRVAFPEVGLTEAGREAFRPLRLIRFGSALEGERAPVITEAIASAYRDGDCLIALNVEDAKALRYAPYMRRYLQQHTGVSAASDGVSILGSSILISGPNVRNDDIERMLAALIQSQMLFVVIFSFQGPREVSLDWGDVYGSRQVAIADRLKSGEVALFRSNLRSQDVFELSTVELI